jgi:methionyl-tRNA synthetase
MKNKFYITTSIAYANADPHVGFALELIQADVLARYHKLLGEETWFLTGTDEHGTKIARTAEANHKEPKEFVDGIVSKFEALPTVLNVANDDFIRTTDQTRHWPAVQKLWGILADKDDLYKKNYEGYYCVGHEAFIKKNELIDGVCPIHKTTPETVVEENWFFKLSKYTQEIKKKIETDELKILPVSKKNEILNLLDDAEDVSFSRPSKDLKWGIPVPNDSTQTMYVWADALSNYISALGWEHNGDDFQKFWPADIHLIGKDILRFHAMIWPAMLLSAGIELPKAIYVHGFITVNGEKMSKSLGTGIDPFALVEKYGADVVRYFLLREIPSDEDGDFSEEKLIARYNGDLANGLGNLVARVSTLIDNNLAEGLEYDTKLVSVEINKFVQDFLVKYQASIENFKIHEALIAIWELISYADKYVNDTKPWALAKENIEEFKSVMINLVEMIYRVTKALAPFMPETAEKISEVFDFKKEEAPPEAGQLKVRKGAVLFPRH